MTAVRVGASVVLWQTPPRDMTALCRSLTAQTTPIDRLAVYVNEEPDDAVVDAVHAVTAGTPFPVSVTVSRVNEGYAGGHNRNSAALFDAGCDAVLVLNPDVLLDPACVRELVPTGRDPHELRGPLMVRIAAESLTADGTVDSAGIGWTRSGRHLDLLQGRPVSEAPVQPVRVAGLSGACLLVPRSAYARLTTLSGELFDEDFVAYREDAELGLRAQRLGIASWLLPAACAGHVRRLRGTSRDVSPWVNRLSVQNRFLILLKHGRHRPGSPVLALGRDILVVVVVLLRERSSVPGLWRAWQLRHTARRKARLLRQGERLLTRDERP